MDQRPEGTDPVNVFAEDFDAVDRSGLLAGSDSPNARGTNERV